jgi:hypothetical protein
MSNYFLSHQDRQGWDKSLFFIFMFWAGFFALLALGIAISIILWLVGPDILGASCVDYPRRNFRWMNWKIAKFQNKKARKAADLEQGAQPRLTDDLPGQRVLSGELQPPYLSARGA